MRKCSCSGAHQCVLVLATIVLFMTSDVTSGLRTTPSGVLGSNDHQVHRPRSAEKDQVMFLEKRSKDELLKESYVTGSRLPDCTHACGPCFPCKRVMVSFKCAESAESCPIAYRCMCQGKFYHVPSL